MRALVFVAALAGCIEPSLRLCDEGATACPVDTVCLKSGGCGSLADVAACEGSQDGDPCTSTFGAGRCLGGACRNAMCGNAVVESGERCDDGNLANGDGCNGTCTSDETCGNGISELLEACDCGDAENPGGALCAGTVNGGDICRNDCALVRCGNGAIDVLEICDDGNLDSGDGCSGSCTSDETCGNGIVDFFAAEQCDDESNGVMHDGCTDSCLQEPVMWREITTAPSPLARHAHAMVYDSTRETLIAFGGMTGNLLVNFSTGSGGVSAYGDTWEWDPIALHWLKRNGLGPTARFAHAMAYDAARKRVVMFGGFEPNGANTPEPTNDTWEWDSIAGTWTLMTPVDSPPARGFHSMAYDSTRGRIVMFGGGLGDFGDASCGNMPTATFTDTWEWTGTNWIERTPTGTSPPARLAGSLVYDSNRQLSILVPGMMTDGYEEVWEWNGAPVDGVWTPRASSAPTFYGHGGAYDPLRSRVVVYGGENYYTSGCGTVTYPTPTSTWNATDDSWSSTTVTPNPGTRSFVPAAFAENIGATLIFGGQASNSSSSSSSQTHFSDVWSWSGTAWSKATPATPPALVGARVAFDAARQQVVLYGGARGGGSSQTVVNETWIWDGYTWSQRFPADSPGARYGHAMAYDPKLERVILFGGTSAIGASPNNETWTWDGSNWQKLAITGPARSHHDMVYDHERQQIVMFGGSQFVSTYGLYPPYEDTWTFDGTLWSAASTTGPPGRVHHAMAYDTKRKTVVLYGGSIQILNGGGRIDLADTWEWNGTAWSLRSMSSAPGHRDQHVMVNDPLELGVVLFGGNEHGATSADKSQEVWQWDGDAGTWTLRELFAPPPARYGHIGVFDGARHRLTFAFGIDVSATTLTDTWALATQLVGPSAPVDDDCTGGSDLDNDGRVGCADPDCWSYCTPSCPPLTDCPATTTPSCGDDVCDEPRENRLRCPADCP